MRKRICILLIILLPGAVVLNGCTENGSQPDTADVKPQQVASEAKKIEPDIFNLPERTVKRVIDGNTIELGDGEKVRLIGVDIPEAKDPGKPEEYSGKKAAEYIRGAVEGKKVLLSYDQLRKDKSGKTLAYVAVVDSSKRREIDDGITSVIIFKRVLNEEIIKRGYGKVNTKYHYEYLTRFLELEKEAREAGRGLWATEK